MKNKIQNNSKPHWLPDSVIRRVKLTKDQLNYMLPVFKTCGGSNIIDGVTLCDSGIFGHRLAIKTFLRRFEFSDIDISNLIEVSKP